MVGKIIMVNGIRIEEQTLNEHKTILGKDVETENFRDEFLQRMYNGGGRVRTLDFKRFKNQNEYLFNELNQVKLGKEPSHIHAEDTRTFVTLYIFAGRTFILHISRFNIEDTVIVSKTKPEERDIKDCLEFDFTALNISAEEFSFY